MSVSRQPSTQADPVNDFSGVRLVHVVRQYAPNVGGLEDVVANLAARQAGRFADVRVVTLNRLFREPDRLLPESERIGSVDVERIPWHGSSRYPLAPAVLGRIRDADLVHVHAVDFFFDALALSRIWHRRKLVATTHGGFFHTSRYARLKSLWFNTLTRFSATQYDGIACCSESDLRRFQEIAPNRVHLIENGVDIEKFRDAASSAPCKRLLTFGRFSSNKRLDRLIEAVTQLESVDPGWHLDIAGMASDLTAQDLKALAASCGLADKVTVHEGLSLEELRALIGQCSLFAGASDYEGFGLALIEALSAGLMPVVHPNEAFVSLARELPQVRLVDYSNGAEAAAVIAAAYRDLCATPDLRSQAIASVGRFGWGDVARSYDAFYRRALDRPS